MGPFDLLPPLAPDRRGREPDANAWVELHNAVVAAERADEFGPHTVDRIRRQRGVDLREDRFLDRRVRLYRRFLDWSLSDGMLTGDERELMAHLADTLDLAPVHLRDAHRRAFGTVVHDALADDCLDVDERLLLFTLQHTLGLDPELASGAYEVMARERLMVTVARSLCDGELSPDEEAEIARAQEALSAEVPDVVKEMLGAAAERWRRRNAPAPPARPARPAPEAPRPEPPEAPGGPRSREVRAVIHGAWRKATLPRLETMLGAELLASGDTYHYRVPGIALRGVRRRGRIRVHADRVVFDADSTRPNVCPAPSIARVLRFSNGVLVELKSGQALFAETARDGELFDALQSALRQRPPAPPEREAWHARWTPLYAAERDGLLRRIAEAAGETKRRTVALGVFVSARGWGDEGDAVVTPDAVVLQTRDERRRISRATLRAVYRADHRVWLDRRGGHDWILAFATAAEAADFAGALKAAPDETASGEGAEP